MKDKETKDMNHPPQSTDALTTELPDVSIEPQRDLPEEWELVKLGDITKIFVGRDLKEANYSSVKTSVHKYPVYSNTVDNEGLYGYYDIAEYTGESLTIVGRGAGLGTAFTKKGSYGAIGRLLVLFPNEGVVAQFLTEYINCQLNLFKESSGIPQLTGEQISKYKLPLPPLTEQKRIAAILTKWDEGIEKLQAIITRTKQRKVGLMQQLLTGTKRFAEFEEQPIEMVRFGDVFSYIRNESHSRDCLTYEETENQVYYVHYGDIHATFDTSVLDFGKETRIPQLKDEIVLSKQSAFLQDGDLLIADASEDYEGIGECVEVKNLGDKVAVGGLHTIIARDSHNLTVPGFRNYLLMHPEVAIAIRKVANGISVYGLSKTALSNILLYLPSPAEQRRIAAVLSAADLEIEGLTQELNLMQNQKRGLMQGLLTGDISVKTLSK